MTTLTVHPVDEKQEKALKAVLDAMEVKYEEEPDTSEYLLADPAMKKHLQQSMEEAKQGKVTTIPTEDLWK
jgi:hypothetical protein